jgi:hypothetical protein
MSSDSFTEKYLKKAVFWDVVPCSLVDSDQHFMLVAVRKLKS